MGTCFLAIGLELKSASRGLPEQDYHLSASSFWPHLSSEPSSLCLALSPRDTVRIGSGPANLYHDLALSSFSSASLEPFYPYSVLLGTSLYLLKGTSRPYTFFTRPHQHLAEYRPRAP